MSPPAGPNDAVCKLVRHFSNVFAMKKIQSYNVDYNLYTTIFECLDLNVFIS